MTKKELELILKQIEESQDDIKASILNRTSKQQIEAQLKSLRRKEYYQQRVKKDFDPDKLKGQFEAMRNAQGIDDTVSNMNSSFHSKSAVTTNTEKQRKQE